VTHGEFHYDVFAREQDGAVVMQLVPAIRCFLRKDHPELVS